MGFRIVNGKKHYLVIDPDTGMKLAVLPHGQRAYGGKGPAQQQLTYYGCPTSPLAMILGVALA
jgi:hypothetical protein